MNFPIYTTLKPCLCMSRKHLRIHLHTLEMLNYGMQLAYISHSSTVSIKIRHKLVELFGLETIQIVVYDDNDMLQNMGPQNILDIISSQHKNEEDFLIRNKRSGGGGAPPPASSSSSSSSSPTTEDPNGQNVGMTAAAVSLNHVYYTAGIVISIET